MSDFVSEFKSFADSLGSAAKGVMGKLDQWSFKMLVDNLKANDFEAVKESIEQLKREKKPLAIPPLYFVAKQHPNPQIRQLAEKALTEFDQHHEIESLTAGKSAEEATKALIDQYGNYKR